MWHMRTRIAWDRPRNQGGSKAQREVQCYLVSWDQWNQWNTCDWVRNETQWQQEMQHQEQKIPMTSVLQQTLRQPFLSSHLQLSVLTPLTLIQGWMCKKCVLSGKQIQTILGCHCGQNGLLLCFLMTNYYAMKRVMQSWQSWASC